MHDDWREWTVPGRPEDWPPLHPTPPEKARELGRFHALAAARWEASGRDDLAASDQEIADALFAQAEAVENGDCDAWLDALAAEVRANRGVGPAGG